MTIADWKHLILEHGVRGCIESIIKACEDKAQYYLPKYSAFQAYADALKTYLPAIMQQAIENVITERDCSNDKPV